MKSYKNYISIFVLVVSSFGAGAAVSLADFASPAPTSNQGIPSFDFFTMESSLTDTMIQMFAPGRIEHEAELGGSITANGNNITMPGFNSNVVSLNSGIQAIGSVGLRLQNGYNDGTENTYTYGRFGAEGIVRGNNSEARGYIGYLDYDPNGNAVAANNIDVNLIEAGVDNAQYVPISEGIPYAFYTEDTSVLGDTEITGTIISDIDGPGYIEIDDELYVTGSVSVNGTIENLDDLILTEPLWDGATGNPADNPLNQIFMQAKSVSLGANPSGNTLVQSTVSCPADTIRIACQVRIDDPAEDSPFIGVRKTGLRDCTSYMNHPAGKKLSYYTFASCYRPITP